MYDEEKIKILENTYNRIKGGNEQLRILGGDLNAPDEERSDGTVIPWRYEEEGPLRDRWIAAEMNILTGLEEFDMVDVFRHLHGYENLNTGEISFRTSDDDPTQGKRFDHLFGSKVLNPESCFYARDGITCSDHAPLIANFSPSL